ncbi:MULTISPECIES: hypothetical protein [unclassified Spirosoma]|uniref:hypothetical protein n=1 Tax=unclassified Spirosoma TaxID=2621999 RepID=UPI00096536A8|nr:MULTISPECIES: hypothetical protein [unclassified Spirosoma]MBN8823066.1 hypothetical protein [Spirosoma sp.]OJW73162.1 MAG: hypothetical protein BGO59_06645 [Spirosoma sp. 48-14]
MKRYLYTFIFLILAVSAYSQKVDIPKGANRIEITSTLSDSALVDMIAFRLESSGFFIEQLDKSKGFVMTEYKNMSNEISIRIFVRVEGNKAVFNGQGNAEMLGYQYRNTPLLFKGSTGGVEKGGFIAMDGVVKKLAKTVGASNIAYLLP